MTVTPSSTTFTRRVGIIDTTLRDAQQCLWASYMTTEMMLPLAGRMDRAGFEMIDFMAPVQFDACVRYLKEDPFEKARILRREFQETPLRGYTRSKSLVGFNLVADDIVELWVERLFANGFRVVATLDALFDVDNMLISQKKAKELGMTAVGALVFCDSPVHTDEVYASTARALVERGDIDGVMIKDSGSLLTPDRIKTMVPALRAAVGPDRKIELHGHCTTALAPLVYMEAVKLGVDQIHTAIAPLASGPAQPSIQLTAHNLRTIDVETGVDEGLIAEISQSLVELAAREGKPHGQPAEYDAFHYKHQMPGGMTEHWRYQLKQAGLLDRFDEILEEISVVREELAWPIMVTPFSQIVAVQAMLNVIHGERYKVVPDEVKLYALGHFGKLLAPVAPDVLDRIVENGSPSIPLQRHELPPALPALRKKYPNADDDERLLRVMFPGNEVDVMLKERQRRSA